MKLDISELKEYDSEEIDVLEFLPCEIDFSTAGPSEILEYKNSWQSLILPNDESIRIKVEFGSGYDVTCIAIQQNNKSIFSLMAKEIISFSFKTFDGLNIGVQIEI